MTEKRLSLIEASTMVETTARSTPVAGWLRVEGLAVLLLATGLYAQTGSSWLLFLALFLAPDLSMLGYVRGPRTGAIVYNLGHTYTAPALLAAGRLLLAHGPSLSLALIWTAHIGFDRLLGYGLKLPAGFQHTHLGRPPGA